MNAYKLLVVLAATLPLAACAASSEVIDESDTTEAESAASKHKFHYEPSVEGVYFAPGCGIVRPDMPPCYSGFVMTFTKNYIDLTATITHHTDNKRHTIDIDLDTWSYNTVHPMVAVRPQDEQLGSLETQIGTEYTVTVWDRKHEALWTGKITPRLAM